MINIIIPIDWTTLKSIKSAKATPIYYAQLKPQLDLFMWDDVRDLAYTCTLGFGSEEWDDFELNFKAAAIEVTSTSNGIALKLTGIL